MAAAILTCKRSIFSSLQCLETNSIRALMIIYSHILLNANQLKKNNKAMDLSNTSVAGSSLSFVYFPSCLSILPNHEISLKCIYLRCMKMSQKWLSKLLSYSLAIFIINIKDFVILWTEFQRTNIKISSCSHSYYYFPTQAHTVHEFHQLLLQSQID